MKKTKMLISLVLAFSFLCISALADYSITMYALDGRTATVPANDVDAWLKVGWYRTHVTMMYSTDGRYLVVETSKVPDYRKVGWYTLPGADYEKCIGKTFSQVETMVGKLYYAFAQEGGKFYGTGYSNVYFSFDMYPSQKSACRSVFGLIKDLFPDLAAKANYSGNISPKMISDYFKAEYHYEPDDSVYAQSHGRVAGGGFGRYSFETGKYYQYVLDPQRNGYCNINSEVIIKLY